MHLRSIFRVLCGAGLAWTLAICLPGVRAAQDSGGSTFNSSELPPVFDAPPEEELAKITHPELREELLLMAAEDQEARRRGP